VPGSLQTRAHALAELCGQVVGCTRCPKLAATRTQVVFGSGPASAQVMFVGEAPGVAEDREGVPLTGAAGALLDEVLAAIGLRRDEVAVVNLVKCRPPDNRSPLAAEIENCREHLLGQVELIRPVLVCSLGTFPTRLLRGKPAGITAVRGQDEVVVLGTRAVRLLPLLHPAAALYTPAAVEQLVADAARIPALLALGAPEQPAVVVEAVSAPEDVVPATPDRVQQRSVGAIRPAGPPGGLDPQQGPDPDPEADDAPLAPPEAQLNLF
jgi:uracil-DNA glycosylase family 4